MVNCLESCWVKSVLADKDEIETLIFDEIDGGLVKNRPESIRTIFIANHQIICITHLAQIAASRSHFTLRNNPMVSQLKHIKEINEEESIVELSAWRCKDHRVHNK